MEQWKQVPGYEGLYEVSNLGRFRALDRVIADKNGFKKRYKGRILNLDISSAKGYACVHFSKNGKARTYSAHRIVAECFIGKIPGKPFVNHKDGDKGNCAASNLEWVTASENAKHAYEVLGRKPPRLGTCGTKFTPDEVRAIRKDDRPVRVIAEEYKTSRENIYNIRKRKTYATVSD